MIPNFLIIGAQKAGTTSLINYLSKHPDIFVPEDKEISCFYNDADYNKRFIKYPFIRYYDNWKKEKYAGNAPVNLLYFAKTTSKLIYELNPSIKLIAILRNPIERLYSAYWFFVRCGLETESLDSALKRELYILKRGNFKELSNFTYVGHGFYYEQLMNFYKFFDRNQILVLLYDDFKNDPAQILKSIYNFLEVKEYINNDLLHKKYNVSSKARIQSIHNFVFRDHFIKYIYKRVIPEGLRYKVRLKFNKKILKRNLEQFNYPPIQPSTKQYLLKVFEEPNNKLQSFIGRELSGWQF
jgi:hypothetical protein